MYMYARALGSNANCTDLKIAEDGVTRVVKVKLKKTVLVRFFITLMSTSMKYYVNTIL